jgi:hypothetical protein
LLGDPGGRGGFRAAGPEHPPDLQLDKEPHEQPLQPDRLDRAAVTGEPACGVGAAEGAPESAGPPRRRRDAVPPQQRPERGGGGAVPELEQVPAEPLLAPAGVLLCQRQDQGARWGGK